MNQQTDDKHCVCVTLADYIKYQYKSGGNVVFSEREREVMDEALRKAFAPSHVEPQHVHAQNPQKWGYCLHCDQRIEASAPSATERRWIDVNDQLPPDAPIEVITVSASGELVASRSARWVRRLHADAKLNDELCAVSHWMPLPEAP